MIYLITLTLLLFEFQYSYGHTLPRKQMLKNVDFYSIQGSNNESITLVSSKSENPTVKEIIYYHVIERPYEKSQVMVTHTEETDEGPDFDDTKRPFTNGHGLQFSDLDSDEHDSDTSEETDSSDEDNSQSSDDQSADDDGNESDDNVSEPDDDSESDDSNSKSDDDDSKTEDEDSNDNDDVSGESGNDDESDDATDAGGVDDYNENARIDRVPVETIRATEQTVTNKVTSEATESIESSTVKMTEHSREPSTSKTEAVLVTTEPVLTTAVDDVINEKRAVRNMLFNQLRDRYQKSLKPSKVSSRKKRNAEYAENEDDDKKELPEMPEAPTLPELNYDQLPTYVREMISTEKPVIPEQDKEDDEITDKEIEHRIEEMIKEVMRPYEEELEGEEDGSQEEKPKKPRTYGMKLKAGNGYVWNDLWSNPGMSFDVGDSPAHSSEEDSKENLNEKPEYDIEPYDKDTSEEIQAADDYKPNLEDIFINKNKDKNDNNKETKETDYIVNEEDKSKETTESDLHDNKLVHTDITTNESQENETEKGVIDKKCDENLQEDILDHKYTTKLSVDESKKKNNKEMNSNSINEKSLTPEGNSEKDMEHHKPMRIESMLELLKDQDEDFWTWLQDWTSTYMDLLMKHIKKIVQQEVKKHIKLNNEHLNKDKTTENSESSIETQKDEKEIKNAQEELLIETNKDKIEIENAQGITKDGSVIVDGVQIPLTHNTNFDSSVSYGDDEVKDNIESDLLKGRRHKEKEKDNIIISEVSNIHSESDHKKPDSHNVTDVTSKKEGRIEANNIFGNSYNNDKVTNIYIFYPKADTKKIIKDLTSDKGYKNNTFVFGKPDNSNVEEREDISTEDKKEEPKPIKEESAAITDKIDEITAPITSAEDKETSLATESSNKNEDSENKNGNSGNDKELEEIHKENSSVKEDSVIDEKDITSEKDHNIVAESLNKIENKADESENNNKELEETPKESNSDSTTDKKYTSDAVDSIDKSKETDPPNLRQ